MGLTPNQRKYGEELLYAYSKYKRRTTSLLELERYLETIHRHFAEPGTDTTLLDNLLTGKHIKSDDETCVARYVLYHIRKHTTSNFDPTIDPLYPTHPLLQKALDDELPKPYTPEVASEVAEAINTRLKEDLTKPFYISREEVESMLKKLEQELPEKVLDLMISKGYVFKKKE